MKFKTASITLFVAVLPFTNFGPKSSLAAQPAASTYTKIDFTLPDKKESIEYGSNLKCKGYAGYQLSYHEYDTSSYLEVKLQGKWESLVGPEQGGSWDMVAEGKRIEWRGTMTPKGTIEPYAMIYPYRGHHEDYTTAKPIYINSLVIQRLSRKNACKIGEIRMNNNPRAHQQARDLADKFRDFECP